MQVLAKAKDCDYFLGYNIVMISAYTQAWWQRSQRHQQSDSYYEGYCLWSWVSSEGNADIWLSDQQKCNATQNIVGVGYRKWIQCFDKGICIFKCKCMFMKHQVNKYILKCHIIYRLPQMTQQIK